MNEQIKNFYNEFNKQLNKNEQFKQNNMSIENNNVNLQIKLGKLEQELYIATGTKKFDYGYSFDKYKAQTLEELYAIIKKETKKLNPSNKQYNKNYLFLDEYIYYNYQCDLATKKVEKQNKALSSSNRLREDIYFIKALNKTKNAHDLILNFNANENSTKEEIKLKGVFERIQNKIKIANKILINNEMNFSK